VVATAADVARDFARIWGVFGQSGRCRDVDEISGRDGAGAGIKKIDARLPQHAAAAEPRRGRLPPIGGGSPARCLAAIVTAEAGLFPPWISGLYIRLSCHNLLIYNVFSDRVALMLRPRHAHECR